MTPRTIVAACVFGIVATVGVSLLLERRAPEPTAGQAVAHERTQVAVAKAAHSDTVFRAAKLDAATARELYRSVRDSALRDLRDTALVKRAFAKADTAFVHDTTVIVRADTVIQHEKDARAATADELRIALIPKHAPRLGGVAAVLYEPLQQIPSASLTASFRVIGRWSVLVRGDQRFAPGESPRVAAGVALSF